MNIKNKSTKFHDEILKNKILNYLKHDIYVWAPHRDFSSMDEHREFYDKEDKKLKREMRNILSKVNNDINKIKEVLNKDEWEKFKISYDNYILDKEARENNPKLKER